MVFTMATAIIYTVHCTKTNFAGGMNVSNYKNFGEVDR